MRDEGATLAWPVAYRMLKLPVSLARSSMAYDHVSTFVMSRASVAVDSPSYLDNVLLLQFPSELNH